MNHLYTIQLQNEKWYVGITKNFNHRMDQHVEGAGAAWCRKHGPSISSNATGQYGENARWEETKKTLNFMMEYGLNNVRGAEYCQLADFDRADAKRMSYAAAHHLPNIDRETVEKKFERACAGFSARMETSTSSLPYQNKMGTPNQSVHAWGGSPTGSSPQVLASPLKRATSASSRSGAADILGILRSIRDSCAKSKGIPSYAVFTNDTLQEMAEVLPTTEEMFLSIKGVGKIKCKEYGHLFMSAINEGTAQYCDICEKKIDVNPSRPVCIDCYRAKRTRK
jgi:superfamily II DNA helicase RecQ